MQSWYKQVRLKIHSIYERTQFLFYVRLFYAFLI
jgi:hypothetical protein